MNENRTSNQDIDNWLTRGLQQAEIYRVVQYPSPTQAKMVALADEVLRLRASAEPRERLYRDAAAKLHERLGEFIREADPEDFLEWHRLAPVPPSAPPAYQARVARWAEECFGADATDKPCRNWRFIEEAIELVQSLDCPREDVHMLVDYVYDRPIGEPSQEVGGTMVGLAVLCYANGLSLTDCAEKELSRIQGMKEQIRAKHLAKPRGSPLPSVQGPQYVIAGWLRKGDGVFLDVAQQPSAPGVWEPVYSRLSPTKSDQLCSARHNDPNCPVCHPVETGDGR